MAFTILAVGVPMSLLAGCEKKKPPPVVEAPPPPPPPVPEPVQVEPIMQAMAPSAKVQFPQSAAPHSDPLARAIISFADALAKGDATKFGSMLNPLTAKPLLSQLMTDGSWDTCTAAIESVRIIFVNDGVDPSATSAAVYFAVQAPEGAYVLGWGAAKVGEDWTFSGAPATDQVLRRASEWDNVGFAALVSDAPITSMDITDIPDAPETPKDAPLDEMGDPAPSDPAPSNPSPGGPAPAPGSGG